MMSPTKNPMTAMRLSFAAVLTLCFAGCALTVLPSRVDALSAPQWNAPLPHHGSLQDLTHWWQQQGDALLVDLVEAGQRVSPTIAAAATRIAQARATNIGAGAALLPKLDATASANRSSAQLGTPAGTTVQTGLQTAWEIDLFGANRRTRNRTEALLDGAQAGWHDARVAVAADIANQYYGLRACQQLLEVSQADAASRAETARLSELSAQAGFTAPATAALARASTAESNARLLQQRAACDVDIKALVALTDIAEAVLRQRLTPSNSPTLATLMPAGAPVPVPSVPAQLLRQRPDLYAAEREVAAASAAVGSTEAQRYPRLSLSGQIAAGRFNGGGVSTNATTWTIGPLALSLPIFDGGTRAANVTAARASYDEAVIVYRAKVRQAVREVEEALVNLASTQARSDAAQQAVAGYRASFEGTQSRYQSGLASLVELEDARRLRLNAEIALITLQQQRSAAWIGLYRAVGGGWQADNAAANVY